MIVGAAVLMACAHTPAGDQGNPTGTVGQQLGVVSAVIANVPFQVQLTQGINYKLGQFTLVALALDEMQRQLVLSLRDVAGPGTFELCPGSGYSAFFGISGPAGRLSWRTSPTECSGAVTVGFLSAQRAIGRFNFALVPDTTTGATGTVVVSSGTFDVTVAY